MRIGVVTPVALLVCAVSLAACHSNVRQGNGSTPALTTEFTATPESSPTSTAEWSRIAGRGISLELPNNFTGGDLENDVAVLAERLTRLGPQFSQLAELLTARPDVIRFLAFDTSNSVAFPTAVIATVDHVLSIMTLDQYGDLAEKQFQTIFPGTEVTDRESTTVGGYEALRIVVSLGTRGPKHTISLATQLEARVLVYMLKLGNVIWNVEMTTPAEEVEERSADLDRAIQTFRPEFVRMKSAAEEGTAGCGTGSSITLAGDSPIGQVYRAGQSIHVIVRYVAPSCAALVGVVTGYHGERSDWYQYWCVDHPGLARCAGRRLLSYFTLIGPKIDDAGRSLSLRLNARTGSMPPPSIDSPPPADGFTACAIALRLSDLLPNGNNVDYTLGEPC